MVKLNLRACTINHLDDNKFGLWSIYNNVDTIALLDKEMVVIRTMGPLSLLLSINDLVRIVLITRISAWVMSIIYLLYIHSTKGVTTLAPKVHVWFCIGWICYPLVTIQDHFWSSFCAFLLKHYVYLDTSEHPSIGRHVSPSKPYHIYAFVN